MYSYLYYIIFWAIGLVFTIPVLFVGVIYIFMSNKPQKKNEFTIKVMLEIIKSAKTKEAFTAALKQFKNKYHSLNNEKNIDVWLECIKQLAHSTYWDTDAIAKFGQELEDANPTNAKKISVAIATVLKTKEQKST